MLQSQSDMYGRMMQAARVAASWSRDKSLGVGCVIFDPETGTSLLQGVNGFPYGVDANVPERHERPLKYKFTVHAEINVLAACARYGIQTEGKSVVVTFFPCATCAGALIQAGIRKLVAPLPDWNHERWGEDFKISKQILEEAGIGVTYQYSKEVDQGVRDDGIKYTMGFPVFVTEWHVDQEYAQGDVVFLGTGVYEATESGTWRGYSPQFHRRQWKFLGYTMPLATSVPAPEEWLKDKAYYHGEVVSYFGRHFKARLGSSNGFYPDMYPNMWTLIAGDPISAPPHWKIGAVHLIGDIVQHGGQKYRALTTGNNIVDPHVNNVDWENAD